MNKIEFDPFIDRQFKSDFSGTKLHKIDRNDLLDIINIKYSDSKLIDSDNDFCKYLIFKNHYNEIKCATMPITLDMYPFIRSDYFARTPEELPVLTRFVQLPPNMPQPIANYIVCILYSKEQLEKEHNAKSTLPFYFDDTVEYGCIAIMGTHCNYPDPYVPITMMRNALGVEEGGNGVKLDKIEYLKSVEFWQNNILIK